jgi:hypothetical protein
MVETDPAEIRQQSAGVRSLLPREHGAYAEVAFPLLTGLALGRLSAAQLLLVFATIAAFLAHEPVLVLVGERGNRARNQLRERSQRAAAVLLALVAVSGGLGWWTAPAGARLAVFLPLSLGALLIPLILSRREKTEVGELLVALTFSSVLIPVALAGGVGLRAAVIASVIWGVIFSLGTLTVRAVIARVKKSTNPGRPSYAIIALSLAAIGAAFLLSMTNTLPMLAAAAVLPSALISLSCSLFEVHPRNLRAMGWSMVTSNLIAFAALLVALG